MQLSPQVARDIVDAIAARAFKNPLIEGRGREEPTALKRAEAMYVLRRCGMTQEEVAQVFERDHTTVSVACKRIKRRLETHIGYGDELEQLFGFACKLVTDREQKEQRMLMKKVITADGVTVTRAPGGGGTFKLTSGNDSYEVMFSEDMWNKVEGSIRWHATGTTELIPSPVHMNGHANGAVKPAPTALDVRVNDVERRLALAEQRLKEVERGVARLEGPR